MVESARAYDEETRRARAERILDAAAELMERWGYNRLTMDDVAAQANIGKGTIYLHWKTREALFEAVLDRKMRGLMGDLLAAVRADPYNALPHRIGKIYFHSIMRRPLIRAFFTADMDLLGKLIRRQRGGMQRFEGLRTDFVQLLMDKGVVRTDIPASELSYAFRAMILGFFLADPFSAIDATQPSPERKAELLSRSIKAAFELDREHPREAVEEIAQRVIYLLQNFGLEDVPAGLFRSTE